MKWLAAPALMMTGGVLLLAGRGCDVGPGPSGDSPLTTACLTYRDLLATVSETAIDKLESGELATDEAARSWLEAARKEAQRTAWRPIAERDQERLGNGKWTAAEHAATLREMLGQ